MTQPREVPSPCVNVCEMDAESGYCRGCWRTITEIAAWSAYSASEKRKVLQVIKRRARQKPARASSSPALAHQRTANKKRQKD